MKENKEAKKEWVAPEILDLDLDKTMTGDIHPREMDTTAGPS